MKQIASESAFAWKQILFIISLPFLLIQILFGKKKLEDLFNPFKYFFHFAIQAQATFALIIINCIVFLVEFFLDKTLLESLVFQPEHLYSLNFIPIIASWFLHAGILHLAGNMLFLFIFGRVVEKNFGSGKFLLIYFGTAIISSVLSGLLGQGGIGASGAIAGVISAAILIQPFYLTYLIIGIPLPIIAVGWLAIIGDITGILVPTNDNIGHFAHLGGYLAITVLIFLLEKKDKEKMKKGFMLNLLFALILGILYYLRII
jgi:membrane associated rhomboid family serine protease